MKKPEGGGFMFCVWGKTRFAEEWSPDSRTEALCLAIAHAYGWKEAV